MSVDALARLARDAEPPVLDDIAAQRLVERALVGAVLGRPAPRRTLWFLVPAVAAAITVVAWLALRAVPAVEPELARMTLPTGDKLATTHDARFEITELEASSRKFRVHAGTMMFDVAKVVADQRFEVVTSHVRVIARGTVFSVATSARSTLVRVYEGVVEVVHGDVLQRLERGTSWSSDGSVRADSRLAAIAAEHVRARAETATPTEVASEPPVDVEPVIEPIASPPAPDPQPSAQPRVTAQARETVSPRVTAQPPESLDTMLSRAQAHLTARRFNEALAEVRLAEQRGGKSSAWLLVEGDALRGLGRADDAAAAFEEVAKMTTGATRAEAAYSAAYLRFHDLRDGPRALDILDHARVDAEGSLLEERGLALRVQILVALKRDASAEAQRYLDRFPRGGLRAYMLAVRRESGSGSPPAK